MYGLRIALCAATMALLASTEAQIVGISSLTAAYPNCSLNCMAEFLPISPCYLGSEVNVTCMCADEAFNGAVALCAAEHCTVKELLTTQNTSSTACGAPVRDHSKDITIIGLSWGSIAFVFFIVRIMARLFTREKKLYSDDYVLTLMVLVTIPPTVLAPFLASNGLGRDMWTVPFDNITNVLLYFFIGSNCYLVGLALNKISILCFFLRIFPVRALRTRVYVVMSLCAAYGVAFFCATLLQCTPISYAWTSWSGEFSGKCNNFHLQGWLAAAFNISLDLLVILLPMGELYHMNMSTRKKLMVILMFMTGIFVTIVSGIRLKYLVQFRDTHNPTWDFLAPGYWSVIELHIGIICACMPAVYSLIQLFWPKLVSGTTRGHPGPSEPKSSDYTGQRTPHRTARIKASGSSDFILLTDVEMPAPSTKSSNKDMMVEETVPRVRF